MPYLSVVGTAGVKSGILARNALNPDLPKAEKESCQPRVQSRQVDLVSPEFIVPTQDSDKSKLTPLGYVQ